MFQTPTQATLHTNNAWGGALGIVCQQMLCWLRVWPAENQKLKHSHHSHTTYIPVCVTHFSIFNVSGKTCIVPIFHRIGFFSATSDHLCQLWLLYSFWYVCLRWTTRCLAYLTCPPLNVRAWLTSLFFFNTCNGNNPSHPDTYVSPPCLLIFEFVLHSQRGLRAERK